MSSEQTVDRDGRARRRRARPPGRGDPRGPGRPARRGDPDHAGGHGRRHRDHARQARRAACEAPARSAPTRSATCCSSCSDATAIDTSLLVRRDGVQTSASVLPIRPDGSRPAFHVIGANATYDPADAPWDDIAAATHLHLGAPEFMGGEEAAKILSFAREHGVVTSADILAPGEQAARSSTGSRPPSRTSTTCCPTTSRCSRSAARTTWSPAAGRCSSAASAASPPPAAATAPSWSTPTAPNAVPAFPVEVVDTTGCGDAFSAGFLRGLALGREPPRRRDSRLRRRRPRRPGPRHRPRRLRPRRRRRARRKPRYDAHQLTSFQISGSRVRLVGADLGEDRHRALEVRSSPRRRRRRRGGGRRGCSRARPRGGGRRSAAHSASASSVSSSALGELAGVARDEREVVERGGLRAERRRAPRRARGCARAPRGASRLAGARGRARRACCGPAPGRAGRRRPPRAPAPRARAPLRARVAGVVQREAEVGEDARPQPASSGAGPRRARRRSAPRRAPTRRGAGARRRACARSRASAGARDSAAALS